MTRPTDLPRIGGSFGTGELRLEAAREITRVESDAGRRGGFSPDAPILIAFFTACIAKLTPLVEPEGP